MLDEFKATDEEQMLLLEEEFRELTLKEAQIFEQLTQVRAAKQRVRRLVAEKRNRHAPIFTLPDELLVCIVEAGQQSTDLASAPIEVLASHISQRFRWAVIGAPCLWRSIELHWGVESDEERFTTYLERARPCTLSVACKYSTYFGEEECDYALVPNELAAVAKDISRIRRLSLHCGGIGLGFEDVLVPLFHGDAPCLEYLEISALRSEVEEPVDEQYVVMFTGGAPCLTTLKLNNAFPSRSNPWLASLTSLDVRGIQSTSHTCLSPQIYRSCPQLIDLTLDGSTFFANDLLGERIPMLFLRSLKGLCLESSRRDALIIGAVRLIHAPALAILQFSGVHGTQISDFFNLLPPSKFPALRSLTFANSSVPCKEFPSFPDRVQPQVLRRFPVLESLIIVNVCQVNQLLVDILSTSKDADGHSSCGLSALHTLTLRYKDADDFGIASWPKLQSAPTDQADAHDPLPVLRKLIASRRETCPLRLRIPLSRFFTDSADWDHHDVDFEIFDVQPLLRSLGHNGDDEVSDLVLLEVD
ncbi:hypothetical protein C8R44DRAFT_872092 [Mycena epipterygia]|nr:hypothetical protein C8R44DRAFT_872092 [Mycena epipterygia]